MAAEDKHRGAHSGVGWGEKEEDGQKVERGGGGDAKGSPDLV